MSRPPIWDGKVYRQMKFGDTSIKGTAKEAELKMRQRARRRDYEGKPSSPGSVLCLPECTTAMVCTSARRDPGLRPSEAIALRVSLPSERGKAMRSRTMTGDHPEQHSGVLEMLLNGPVHPFSEGVPRKYPLRKARRVY